MSPKQLAPGPRRTRAESGPCYRRRAGEGRRTWTSALSRSLVQPELRAVASLRPRAIGQPPSMTYIVGGQFAAWARIVGHKPICVLLRSADPAVRRCKDYGLPLLDCSGSRIVLFRFAN